MTSIRDEREEATFGVSRHATPLRPGSARMELAWRQVRLPEPEELFPGTWVVPFPTETDFVPYTLSYLFSDDRGNLHIIDPGWDNSDNRRRLADFLDSVGAGLADVASTLVSHFHPDHFGMAAYLRESSGAEIVLSEREQAAIDGPQKLEDPLDEWGVPADRRPELEHLQRVEHPIDPVRADRLVHEGDVVGGPGKELRVLETAGHTEGHISFVSDQDLLVFTGDHLLPRIHPGLGLGPGRGSDSNTLSQYFDGLRRVAQFDEHLVCPGHEYTFWGAARRCLSTAAHHSRRSDEVRSVLEIMPEAPTWEVARRVTWAAGWDALHTYRLRSALRQIAMHIAHLRVAESGTGLDT